MLGDAGDHADQMVCIKFVISDELADFGQCRPLPSLRLWPAIARDRPRWAGSEPFILDVRDLVGELLALAAGSFSGCPPDASPGPAMRATTVAGFWASPDCVRKSVTSCVVRLTMISASSVLSGDWLASITAWRRCHASSLIAPARGGNMGLE